MPYDGYVLTSLGYDFLALRALIKQGIITELHTQIGVGKESDIYLVKTQGSEIGILKLTRFKIIRLGRTSFRTIKNNRDYIKHRTSYNWLYLSRLSAIKEFNFLTVLYEVFFIRINFQLQSQLGKIDTQL